jgi:hypothetical protein
VRVRKSSSTDRDERAQQRDQQSEEEKRSTERKREEKDKNGLLITGSLKRPELRPPHGEPGRRRRPTSRRSRSRKRQQVVDFP